MRAQRTHAKPLGGVVSRGNVGNPRLAGQMHRRLGNFSREVGIDPERQRLFERPLRRTGAPGNTAHRTRRLANHLRRPSEHSIQPLCQSSERFLARQLPPPSQILVAKTSEGTKPARKRELRVVAEVGMGIEGNMVGHETDIRLQQRSQAPLAQSGDASILAAPEIAVVHQQQIRIVRYRSIDQRLTCRNAGNDAPYHGPSFHLQPVWAIIPKAFCHQQFVEVRHQFIPLYCHKSPFTMRKLWLIFAQAVTVCLAAFFVVATLRPEWLGRTAPQVVALQEAASTPDTPRPGSFRDAARKALPSVVHIFTSKEVRAPRHPLFDDPAFRQFFGDRLESETQRSSGLGSGVIVSANGYILTNYHVIEAASEIEVAVSDGRKFKARVVGSDPESDLAVLQVRAAAGTTLKLPAITFGQEDQSRVGDVVLAIGNPFGVGQTVTMGIISALGRSHLGINTFENFIQTDAAINPGNSGGALIDTHGNLIGINTAIFSQSGGSLGIGFAIPVSSARTIMEQIIQNGSVIRGWIGVEAQEITPELAESFGLPNTDGALIAGVLRESPADRAGIKPGDVLLAVAERTVKDPQAMLDLIAALKPGESVTFRVRRSNQVIDKLVKIGKRPRAQREE